MSRRSGFCSTRTNIDMGIRSLPKSMTNGSRNQEQKNGLWFSFPGSVPMPIHFGRAERIGRNIITQKAFFPVKLSGNTQHEAVATENIPGTTLQLRDSKCIVVNTSNQQRMKPKQCA